MAQPYKGTRHPIQARLPTDLYQRVVRAADEMGWTLSDWTMNAISRQVTTQEKRNPQYLARHPRRSETENFSNRDDLDTY